MVDIVKASLPHFVPPSDGSKPYIMINADSKTGQRLSNFTMEPYDLEIENLRGKEDTVSLDTTGFQFFRTEAKHKSFNNDEEIEKEYYPESVELLKQLTGANRVVIFDHSKLFIRTSASAWYLTVRIAIAVRRRRPGEIDDSPQKREPVPRVHVDQTTAASVARVHRHLPAEEVPELLKKRFQIVSQLRFLLSNCLFHALGVD